MKFGHEIESKPVILGEPNQNPLAASVRVLGLYVRGQFLIFLWEILLYAALFAVARVPLWPILALACAALGWIPRFGSLIGLGLVILADALFGRNLGWIGFAVGVWAIVQGIESFWLAPRLLGRRLGLRPMGVFLALIVGSLLFGPIGLIVAVPVLAVAMVWWRYFRGMEVLPGPRRRTAPPNAVTRISGR